MLSTVSARSCLLHPSLQFIAELSVINCPPIINIVSEDVSMSIHEKLRLKFRSEGDYVISTEATVTHVLLNCQTIKSASVAEVRPSYSFIVYY